MVQTFPCKHPGCDATVTYDDYIVHGANADSFDATATAKKRRTYLKCPKGHEEQYEVDVEK